jgi:Mg/Co/Ni transporter MgtE
MDTRKQSGKNVKVYFTIPIMFKMSGNVGVKAAELKKL